MYGYDKFEFEQDLTKGNIGEKTAFDFLKSMHYNVFDTRDEHAAYDYVINYDRFGGDTSLNEFVEVKDQECLNEDKIVLELEVIGGEGKAWGPEVVKYTDSIIFTTKDRIVGIDVNDIKLVLQTHDYVVKEQKENYKITKIIFIPLEHLRKCASYRQYIKSGTEGTAGGC